MIFFFFVEQKKHKLFKRHKYNYVWKKNQICNRINMFFFVGWKKAYTSKKHKYVRKKIVVKEGKHNTSELPSKVNNKAYIQSLYK